MPPKESETIDFDQLWDYQQPAKTEERFRRLLPEISGSRRLELLSQIARAQGLQRKFEEAHQTLDEVQQQLNEPQSRPTIRYLLERGRVYNSSKQPELARPLFLESWEKAQTAGEDALAVDAAHMLAIVEPPDQQLVWNLKALRLAEQSSEPRARQWLGSLYNNIGWTHHDLGQYEQALETFQKAAAWQEAQNQPAALHIARWCIARTLRSLQQIEEALAMQQALLQELAQNDQPDGYVCEELAECLLLLNRSGEARPYFARAYEILAHDPWLAHNEPGRLERLRKLGILSG